MLEFTPYDQPDETRCLRQLAASIDGRSPDESIREIIEHIEHSGLIEEGDLDGGAWLRCRELGCFAICRIELDQGAYTVDPTPENPHFAQDCNDSYYQRIEYQQAIDK